MAEAVHQEYFSGRRGVGARRRDRLQEALGALRIELSAQELAAIEAAVPASAVG